MAEIRIACRIATSSAAKKNKYSGEPRRRVGIMMDMTIEATGQRQLVAA